jgi:hypothetical protein
MARSSPTSAALAAEIREHRVYFEVQRETAQVGDTRMTVALQIWLWATVPKRESSLPGGPGCRAALAALQAAAAESVARAGIVPAPDVEPFHWALYESRHVPDADEIRIALNLRAPPGVDGPEQARRERALAELRRALGALGIFEGAWRPGPAPAPVAAPTADPWVARPAGQVFGWSLAPAPA